MSKAYRVHVVVDPHYGDLILDLPVDEPAWIVDSPNNRYFIEKAVEVHRDIEHWAGITSFKFVDREKPDDRFISILWSVDLHHGKYSHDPPYSILNVIGVEWSEKIQKELNEFGFNSHEATPQGFVAIRELDEGPPEGDRPKLGSPVSL